MFIHISYIEINQTREEYFLGRSFLMKIPFAQIHPAMIKRCKLKKNIKTGK